MAATGPTGYDIIALIVAGVGVILGAASLGWNLAEFRLSGPRIKAHLMFGALGNGGIASKRGREQPDWRRMAEQGLTEPLVGIEVVNVGRTPTEVQHFSCDLTGGFGYANPALPYNPPLSFKLDPHATKTLWLPLREVLTLAQVIRDTGQRQAP